ncbi:hypothetical protein [Cerasicoccus frondis]|uniref:hypothetical protein n=1 Tax=Cerasicoccus frondis TaxID=490090 RepID=UPI002852A37A|nr:hypothetical protein [Cerasicoccus frondis]
MATLPVFILKDGFWELLDTFMQSIGLHFNRIGYSSTTDVEDDFVHDYWGLFNEAHRLLRCEVIHGFCNEGKSDVLIIYPKDIYLSYEDWLSFVELIIVSGLDLYSDFKCRSDFYRFNQSAECEVAFKELIQKLDVVAVGETIFGFDKLRIKGMIPFLRPELAIYSGRVVFDNGGYYISIPKQLMKQKDLIESFLMK